MIIKLPLLKQRIVDDTVVSEETSACFEVDTSVYSEERWEQNFPALAQKESLFSYIERIQEQSVSDRVQVTCMLKAIYCFIESDSIHSYKEFAQLINLATPEYTTKFIDSLRNAFKLIINSSSVKN